MTLPYVLSCFSHFNDQLVDVLGVSQLAGAAGYLAEAPSLAPVPKVTIRKVLELIEVTDISYVRPQVPLPGRVVVASSNLKGYPDLVTQMIAAAPETFTLDGRGTKNNTFIASFLYANI